jgi:hypothetical protein
MKPPEHVRRELSERDTRFVIVSFRASADLREAIDNYAATQVAGTRADALVKLVRLGLESSGCITPATTAPGPLLDDRGALPGA